MHMRKLFDKFDLQDKGYLTRREYTALAYYIGKEPNISGDKIFFDDLQFKEEKISDEIMIFLGGDNITEESLREAFQQLGVDDVDVKAFYEYFKKIN